MVKQRYVKIIAVTTLLIILGITTYLRIVNSSPFARSWDQVDFALALHRFDLLAMQPHFPGYPYFILGGMLVNRWVTDPTVALSVFNIWMMLTATYPIYALARKHVSPVKSFLVSTAVQSLSYLWIMSTESMSEAAAVSVLWWFIWSIQKAIANETSKNILLPLFLFSVLLGIRLSYLPFGIGLVSLLIVKAKLFKTKKKYMTYLVAQLFYASLFQFIWVVGLIISEGSFGQFLSLSLQFVFGHFNEWGGAATSTPMPLYERVRILVFHNILWVGISSTSSVLATLFAVMTLLALYDVRKRWQRPRFIFTTYSMLVGSYFLWALFAQNIDKPRHALPVIVMIVFFIMVGFVKSTYLAPIKYALILAFIVLQSCYGYQLIKEKATERPATYQLAEYLQEVDHPFVIYTWEETRIMDFLMVNYPYERVYSYDYFMSNVNQRKNKKVYITNHVLEGFKQQDVQIEQEFKKVKVFTSHPLFDPVYHEIILYEMVKKES